MKLRSIAWVTLVLGSIGCGARSGLFAPPPPEDASTDGADAALDASADSFTPIDSSIDSGFDEGVDSALDSGVDVAPDTNLPEVIVRTDCPDPSVEYVYLVTEQNELLSFYPPDLTFRRIGFLSCPAAPGSNPFSMAVDRKGIAYVDFSDGELFRVSTKNAGCLATEFVATPSFTQFGMGFSTDLGGPSETLFVASENTGGATVLASIDVANAFALDVIGTVQPEVQGTELTGTGDGRLFGFSTPGLNGLGSADANIGQLDKNTAALLSAHTLPGIAQIGGWAFAFYGGEFWVFDALDGTISTVTRYRPADGSITTMASYPGIIVGAGVSTCAPES